jgi:hypothetical protein
VHLILLPTNTMTFFNVFHTIYFTATFTHHPLRSQNQEQQPSSRRPWNLRRQLAESVNRAGRLDLAESIILSKFHLLTRDFSLLDDVDLTDGHPRRGLHATARMGTTVRLGTATRGWAQRRTRRDGELLDTTVASWPRFV